MRQVVDASVVLAYMMGEPGGDLLTSEAGPFALSSVNLTEVLSKLVDRGRDLDDAMNVIRHLPIEHIAYDRADARRAAELRAATRMRGLSLGDRACLALAERLNVPVATADRQWAALDLGVEIRLVR